MDNDGNTSASVRTTTDTTPERIGWISDLLLILGGLDVLMAAVLVTLSAMAAGVTEFSVIGCYAELTHAGVIDMEKLGQLRGGALVEDSTFSVPRFLLQGTHQRQVDLDKSAAVIIALQGIVCIVAAVVLRRVRRSLAEGDGSRSGEDAPGGRDAAPRRT